MGLPEKHEGSGAQQALSDRHFPALLLAGARVGALLRFEEGRGLLAVGWALTEASVCRWE